MLNENTVDFSSGLSCVFVSYWKYWIEFTSSFTLFAFIHLFIFTSCKDNSITLILFSLSLKKNYFSTTFFESLKENSFKENGEFRKISRRKLEIKFTGNSIGNIIAFSNKRQFLFEHN